MVLLASHIIVNKQVALKVVTLHNIKDPYVSKNLKREPAIMAKLSQPIIVSVGDCYCLVLDFYPLEVFADFSGNDDNDDADVDADNEADCNINEHKQKWWE